MGKLIEARIREGRIEPTESVQLPPEGTEVLVNLEEADRANEWFREFARAVRAGARGTRR